MAGIPQVLTKCNMFSNGVGFPSLVQQINLPVLKRKTVDYQGGGMDGPIKIGVGGFEVLEASFTMSGVQTELLSMFGVANDSAFNGNFRSSFKDENGTVVAVVASFRGMLTELDPGDHKPGENAETKYSLSPSYYKLQVGGATIYEFDIVNAVRIINGKDEAAAERAAIGMA